MYIIDKETCIGSGACEGTCPVSAISRSEERRVGKEC